MNERKKLIEVALPINDVNEVAQKEFNSYYGRPSVIHQWWSRKPLSVTRAVIFASLVDDPSSRPDLFPTVADQEAERARLFTLLKKLIAWENSNDPETLAEARREILKSTGPEPPAFFDPFAGGGSIPLEAQRLGLFTIAADLNPVAVAINKATLEIPPRFAGRGPVSPRAETALAFAEWPRATGLAEDVVYYAGLLKKMAFKKVGHLYPPVPAAGRAEGSGQNAAVAWLWARTVKCPNPACGRTTPLANSFSLVKKKGRELHVFPRAQGGKIVYEIHKGPPVVKGTVEKSGGARCLFCQSPIGFPYLREEGSANRLKSQLMAVVVKGQSQLIYLPPDPISEMAAAVPEPEDAPETALPEKALGFRVYRYGFSRYKDLFTPRQLTLLTALGPLVEEAGQMAEEDAIKAGWLDDGKGLAEGGDGAKAYGEAIVVYLSFIVDKIALYHSSLCSWHSSREILGNTFAKRSVPMIWNYAEGNPFSDSSGSLGTIAKWLAESLRNLPAAAPAEVSLRDAQTSLGRKNLLVSTDPPYYDNIGYADLSDFFYVWLRRPLKKVYKSVFARVVTPKSEEIVASPFRFQGDRKKARVFFEAEMSKALRNLRDCADDGFPLTIYYAFKQRESQGPARKPAASPAEGGPWALGEGKLLASTGWEAMLSSIVDSGFAITGTWPILTEKSNRPLSLGVNALSSSIVLVCRKRPSSAPAASLQDFVKALRAELAPALSNLTQANISPVDLAQAAIGPGMAVYSRYSKILEPDGEALTVRRALALINQALDAHFAELEGALDVDSGLCLAVFSEAGFDQLSFGKADVLARAKNSSVARLVAESVLEAQKGQVRLYRPEEIKAPARPGEKNAWRLTHLFLEALRTGGVEACARVALAVGVSPGLDRVKALAYRLYGLCESENWAQLALPYNSLVYAWPEIQAKAILLKDRPPTLEEPRLF